MLLLAPLALAFAPPLGGHGLRPRASARMAEGGPPEIDWQDGSLRANVELSRGTRMLTVAAAGPVAYEPGHILGLEVDAGKGPYTVTRCDAAAGTFDIVYRVIPDGRKTPSMEGLREGAAVRFGGRFGTPIAEGVSAGARRVVGLATGAGVGPLVGYAEAALAAADGPESIELYGGFRDVADVCLAAECDALAAKYPGRFSWAPSISLPVACAAASLSAVAAETERLSGRLTHSVPSRLGTTEGTHFHLIGNGAFVKEFKAGLLGGGVGEEAVTTEIYFNGKAEPREEVVDLVAEAIRALPAAAPAAGGEEELALAPKPEMLDAELSSAERERLKPINSLRRTRKAGRVRDNDGALIK